MRKDCLLVEDFGYVKQINLFEICNFVKGTLNILIEEMKKKKSWIRIHFRHCIWITEEHWYSSALLVLLCSHANIHIIRVTILHFIYFSSKAIRSYWTMLKQKKKIPRNLAQKQLNYSSSQILTFRFKNIEISDLKEIKYYYRESWDLVSIFQN